MDPGASSAPAIAGWIGSERARVRASAIVVSIALHAAGVVALALLASGFERPEEFRVVPLTILHDVPAGREASGGVGAENVLAPAIAPAPATQRLAGDRPRPPTPHLRPARPRRTEVPRAEPPAVAPNGVREPATASAQPEPVDRASAAIRGEDSSLTADVVSSAEGAPANGFAADASGSARAHVSSAGPGGGGALAGSDAIAAYLREIRARLAAHLVFPAAARDLGLHGTVTVRFVIEPDGSLARESLAVEASSGSPILDRAAMATVDRAAPFPRPVSGSCAIRSPVVFTLKR